MVSFCGKTRLFGNLLLVTIFSSLPYSSAKHEIISVGNSYTWYCKPEILLKQLLDEGLGVDSTLVHSFTSGGASINSQKPHTAMLWNSKHKIHSLLAKEPEFLILQDQSQIPALGDKYRSYLDCRSGVRFFRNKVPLKTDLILYMTWGRRNSDWQGCFTNMQENLKKGYEDYRDFGLQSETGGNIYIAPVGLAFKEIHDAYCNDGKSTTECESTGISRGCAAATKTKDTDFYKLYTGDGSHPSCYGCYLAACVFYAVITGKSPVGLSGPTNKIGFHGSCEQMPAEVILKYQQTAAHVVFNVTSDYKYPFHSKSSVPSEAPSVHSTTSVPSEAPSVHSTTNNPTVEASEGPTSQPSEVASNIPSESPSTSNSPTEFFCKTKKDCDDQDPCTRDFCKRNKRKCAHKNICKSCTKDSECVHKNKCRVGTCENNVCNFSPKDCNDHNRCTKDKCSKGICINKEKPKCKCKEFGSCKKNKQCCSGECLNEECVAKKNESIE